MDRDIKFRAKRKDNNEWVYGYYVKHKTTTFCFKEDYENSTDIDKDYIYFDRMTDWGLPNELVGFEVDNKTLGEYTGLKDKNNKEIYEGDVILTQPMFDKPYSKNRKSKQRIGIVKWDKAYKEITDTDNKIKLKNTGHPQFCVNLIDYNINGGYTNADWGLFNDCEVIGNIWDNQDLIKEYE